jgi:hypothetical protein
MSVKSADVIYYDIIAHIEKEGGRASTWYAGITGDIATRLFGAHCVPREGHWYIYRQTGSQESARAIEEALLEYGCDGGSGGGGNNCSYVYAYKKTLITDP